MESKGNPSSKYRLIYWSNPGVRIFFARSQHRCLLCRLISPLQASWHWGIHYWSNLGIVLNPRRLSESSESFLLCSRSGRHPIHSTNTY